MRNRLFSILIIAKDRDEHLTKVVEGVNAMTELPAEIVVVFMNQREHPALDSDLQLNLFDIASANPLPLAQARNLAADKASTDRLLFLDVDCIPEPNYASKMLDALDHHPGLVMGSPLYLPSLRPHPALKHLPAGYSDDYNLFWSLCFAITKLDFSRIGGFDESFVGYGAEDTDFSWAAREAGVRFSHSDAIVHHQHHDSFRPPLNHFDDIVTNANAFFNKWKKWPMEGWINAFAELDLIERTASSIEVLRQPTGKEISDALSQSDF